MKDSLDWQVAQVVKDAAVLFLIVKNATPTLMMQPQLFARNAQMDISAAMVLVNHVQHYQTVSHVLLVMPALVALGISDLIMVFVRLDLNVLSETATLASQEMRQTVKNVILVSLLLLMVDVNWRHAQLVLSIMLEFAAALLVHIKVVVLPAVHAQILTVSLVMLSAVINVLVDSILWVVHVVLVLAIVKNVLMVPLVRLANHLIFFRVANVSSRVMDLALLLVLVERFIHAMQDANHANLEITILLSVLLSCRDML